MTWFYILGSSTSMGGEINATLEQRVAPRKKEARRETGETPPPKRERPSAVPSRTATSA